MATIFEQYPPVPMRYRGTKLVYLAYNECRGNPDYVWCLKGTRHAMRGRKGFRWDSSKNEGWKPVAKADLEEIKLGPHDLVGPAHIEYGNYIDGKGKVGLGPVSDDEDEDSDEAEDD